MDDVELVVDAKNVIGEGPVWDVERARLWWIDILQGTLHSYDPREGAARCLALGQHVGAVALTTTGGLVAAVKDGFAFVDPDSGALNVIDPFLRDEPAMRMNDGKCDPAGRFLAGTMSYEGTSGAGTLYSLDAGLKRTSLIERVTVSNGLGWSSDGSRMYYIDSLARSVDVLDYSVETGGVANRRTLVGFEGEEALPDGMTVDAEGHLWVAMFQGSEVRRYTPSGELAGAVRLPVSLVTSCAFGGADLADLYITTAHADQPGMLPEAGALFRCRPGVRGTPADTFGGD